MAEKIVCQVCGAAAHVISAHLKEHHPELSLEDYRQMYPDAPVLSPAAEKKAAEIKERSARMASEAAERPKAAMAATAEVVPMRPRPSEMSTAKKALHEVFKTGKIKGAMNAKGNPIPIQVIEEGHGFEDFVPEIDGNYIFNVDLLKTVLMGLECNIPVYLFGHAGTGKSTVIEQTAAFTGRPWLRIQHTVNMEEAHVLGQYIVKDGATVWEEGPLPFAMRHGLLYLADEYDFAMPHVLGLYQPVLEGKALIIKEAPPEYRVVKPHPMFRFCGTGNTNGAGDDTGLYQGTNMQNFANYERFGIVEHVEWMPTKQEVGVVSGQAMIAEEDAAKLVQFASEVRKAHEAGRVGATISPRALINAGKVGLRRGNFRAGVKQSFINRLNRVDREVCDQIAQRILG
ncbi:hypothetical protein AY600_02035 [Phormidium willei BDU 130791]|nr:hypothetical protein AY600_02035 [Phormidium willei BDU 130791]